MCIRDRTAVIVVAVVAYLIALDPNSSIMGLVDVYKRQGFGLFRHSHCIQQ